MANNIPRVSMPEQDAVKRSKNFEEVNLGYTKEMAMKEAERCLNCKKPRCVQGCPVRVPIPQFIMKIREGDFIGAYDKIKRTNSLPAVCGRVCPQEEQCEKACVVGIKDEPVAIGRLERFCSDYAMQEGTENVAPKPTNGTKVAVVGAGPAGLTCAGDLSRMGYDVTVFEAFHEPGGVLVYGIPEFRLPKALVQQEINGLKDDGVKFEMNTVIGQTLTLDDLFEEGFKTIFIGSGAGLPRFMNIPGENLNNVYSANEYLTRINLMKAYRPDSPTPIKRVKKAVVVGGGNVAMDAARSALRMGAEVTLVYRRSMEEMPARSEEIHHAVEEGVKFELLVNPVEIVGEDGWVKGIKCVRMELGEPDDSGRRRPVAVEGSEFILETDMVIMAIGTRPNPLIAASTKELETHNWGGIKVDEHTQQTSIEGVYCGGDAATGAATVIKAMGAGKRAAYYMNEYMSKDKE